MNHPTRAVTLVELLVVVAILGVLVSILLPSIHSARSAAKAAVCMSHLRQLGVSNQHYLQDYGSFPPFRLKTASRADYVNGYGRKAPRWQWFLLDLVQPVIDPRGFELPFGDSSVNADGRTGRSMTSPYFLDPAMSGEYAHDIRNGAYGYNYQYLGNSRGPEPDLYYNWPVGDATIRMPSTTVLIADSRGGDFHHGKHSYTLDPPKMAIMSNGMPMSFGPKAPDDGPLGYSPVEMRHAGKGNVAFVDTHVEPLTLKELGYELRDATAVPVDPTQAPDSPADNRMWTGTGRDEERL